MKTNGFPSRPRNRNKTPKLDDETLQYRKRINGLNLQPTLGTIDSLRKAAEEVPKNAYQLARERATNAERHRINGLNLEPTLAKLESLQQSRAELHKMSTAEASITALHQERKAASQAAASQAVATSKKCNMRDAYTEGVMNHGTPYLREMARFPGGEPEEEEEEVVEEEGKKEKKNNTGKEEEEEGDKEEEKDEKHAEESESQREC